ncbi:uncharacterized protein LOC142605805 [Castanea sativa]|uniref:uncharacterized protein LOC142605805 n=1 Tax=Castanea sativa TaxID=21020 RepID=UPI003F64F809
MCPSTARYPDFYTEQANALNNYGKPFASPFSEAYNPNWRNHPNFSWRQNQPPTNQVPAYAKFLKDLVTMKRKKNVPKKTFLTEQVSSIIQNKYPVKCKDPRSPTISCKLGDHLIERALLDLGASVNLLPYLVYLQLGLRELKPTTMTLQLADRSVKIPREWCNEDFFGNITVELNIFHISKQVLENEDIYEVDMIESLVHDTFLQSSYEDPLEACLNIFGCNFDIEHSIEEVKALLDFVPLLSTDSWQPKVIPLPLSSSPPPFAEEPPKLELKPLPDTLKYAFLGSSETLPVIIASHLDDLRECQLISVLQEHKEARLVNC